MPRVTLELPEEVFSALRRSPEEFARDLRPAAAIHWYELERGPEKVKPVSRVWTGVTFGLAVGPRKGERLCRGLRRFEVGARAWLSGRLRTPPRRFFIPSRPA